MNHNLKRISQFQSKTKTLGFRNYFYKISEKFNRKQYISHLIFKTEIKISNYSRLFLLQESAIKSLVEKERGINNENSLVYTFFELKKGMSFVPDLKLLGEALSAKKDLEDKFGIFYAGGVGIINMKLGRNAETLTDLGDYYYFKNQAAVVRTFDEALKVIDTFDM